MKTISIKVANTAKLPLAISRGSEKQRYSLSNNYFKTLREKVLNKKDVLTLSDFKEMINSVLPENNINLNIVEIKDKNLAGSLMIVPQIDGSPTKINITQRGFVMKLPMKNERITDKLTALHEARHFFDHICNPKTIINRSYKLCENNKAYDKRFEIFEMFMRNYDDNIVMKDFRQDVRRRISDLDSYVIIDLLQDLRGSLRTEINAYNGDIKLLIKNPVKNFQKILASLYFINCQAKFKQKLKFSNQLLLEQINLKRKELKNTLSSQKN